MFINRVELEDLIDSGSSESFIQMDLGKFNFLDNHCSSISMFGYRGFVWWTSKLVAWINKGYTEQVCQIYISMCFSDKTFRK